MRPPRAICSSVPYSLLARVPQGAIGKAAAARPGGSNHKKVVLVELAEVDAFQNGQEFAAESHLDRRVAVPGQEYRAIAAHLDAAAIAQNTVWDRAAAIK